MTYIIRQQVNAENFLWRIYVLRLLPETLFGPEKKAL